MRWDRIVVAILVTMAAGATAWPAAATEPSVNTGLTSFMDGFGDPRGEGFVSNQVARFQTAGSIKDQNRK